MSEVIIKQDAYEKLLKLAKEYAPRIVCGFLVGKIEGDMIYVNEVREVKTRCGPRIHFQPVFKYFRQVSEEIDREGKKIVGEFHTHPSGKTEPTRRDRVIMKWLKNGFWIIATENEILPITFKFEEFRKRINRIPYKIISSL